MKCSKLMPLYKLVTADCKLNLRGIGNFLCFTWKLISSLYMYISTWNLQNVYPVFSPSRGLTGYPQEKLRWRIKSQEDAPVWAQRQATCQMDFRSSFNGQPNTPVFCLFKWVKNMLLKDLVVNFNAVNFVVPTWRHRYRIVRPCPWYYVLHVQ